jgi:hypothetical protein
MNCRKFLQGFILFFFLSSGVCIAKEGSLLFEIDIEHHGKGMIEYNLPTAIETGYSPQMVGYWLSNFDVKPNGQPFVVIEVILYGSDFKSGRHGNTVILERGESALVFFHSLEKQPNRKNLPQYCFVQIIDINASKKYVKMRHWISRHPNKKI